MAEQIHVAGLCAVKVAFASGGIQLAGYTRSEADVSEHAFFHNVPGDAHGGDEGPPIDVQILGLTATIRVSLTKWDSTVIDLIRGRVDAGTAGTPPAAGTLMFQDSKAFRLILHSPTRPMNFPRVFARSPIEHGKGTKFTTMVMEFEAHKDGSGVLYNTTVV